MNDTEILNFLDRPDVSVIRDHRGHWTVEIFQDGYTPPKIGKARSIRAAVELAEMRNEKPQAAD